ncbi:hypothetical protein ACFL6C_13440 [Myxococcota bacterium]
MSAEAATDFAKAALIFGGSTGTGLLGRVLVRQGFKGVSQGVLQTFSRFFSAHELAPKG